MDKARAHRAYNLLRDEEFQFAFNDVMAQIEKELFGATSDEDCIKLLRERQAMTRIYTRLTNLSQPAKPKT